MSRDPIGERSGVNLYCFVDNDGVSGLDALGLAVTVTGNGEINSSTDNSVDSGWKYCWKYVKVFTHFGDLASDKLGIRNHKMGPGEVAVGQWSNDTFIRGATISIVEQRQDLYMVLTYGTVISIVYECPDCSIGLGGGGQDVSGAGLSQCWEVSYTVRDYGAYDKKHPKYKPSDWIDIWDPQKSKKQISYGGAWVRVKVPNNCPCPTDYSESKGGGGNDEIITKPTFPNPFDTPANNENSDIIDIIRNPFPLR